MEGVPEKIASFVRGHHMPGESLAHGEHVAMEMHGGLGLAGGARGEGNETDIVLAGRHGGKAIGLCRHRGLERAFRLAISDDPLERGGVQDVFQFAGQFGGA